MSGPGLHHVGQNRTRLGETMMSPLPLPSSFLLSASFSSFGNYVFQTPVSVPQGLELQVWATHLAFIFPSRSQPTESQGLED